MKKPLLSLLTLLCIFSGPSFAASKPNILIILADDLGYGDVQCNNPERGKIPTPHIAPERLTLAGLLGQHGYRTAAMGKWHLGWDWGIAPEQRALFKPARTAELTDAHRAAWREVYARPIGGGPVTHGFDEYFGADVPNWPPFCFIENDRTAGIPGEFLPAALLQGNLASVPGPALPGWKPEDILPALADRACGFIERAAKQTQPFFLYLPLTSPHTPVAVNREWRGKSGLGAYADFVMETDAIVGRVLAALEKSGAAQNTLVVFTSDNGCATYIGVKELEAKGHFPSGPLRGYKADAWEGGHRVPFIVRWPGEVKAGARCDRLVQQTDLMATFAEMLGAKLPADAGEDSVSLLPLLRGADEPVREVGISHARNGLASLRKGAWKIIFGQGGGGLGPKPVAAPGGQLYDLAADLGETKNLWAEKPELVAELTAAMERLVAAHPNDVPVKWQRFLAPAAGKTDQ